MKKIAIEELQNLFGGEDNKSENNCDYLQAILNEYEATGEEDIDSVFYEGWAYAFELCANGYA